MKKLFNLLMVIVAMISVSFVSTGCTSDLDELDGQSFKKILVGEWYYDDDFHDTYTSGSPAITFHKDGTFDTRSSSSIVGFSSGEWELSGLTLTVKGYDNYYHEDVISTVQVSFGTSEDYYTLTTSHYKYRLYKRK